MTKLLIMKGFISHMVQMKAEAFFLDEKRRFHFISHMVQMKALKPQALQEGYSALYPTWFR